MNNNPTCAITGRKDNLQMFAHRNENGDMIGWVFLSDMFEGTAGIDLEIKVRPTIEKVVYRDYIISKNDHQVQYTGPRGTGAAKDIFTVCKQIDSLIDGD